MKLSKSGVAFCLIAAMLCVIMSFQILSLLSDIRDKQSRLDALEQQKEELELENEDLAAAAAEELTEEEIAEIARERLGYAYPNERVFVDVTGK